MSKKLIKGVQTAFVADIKAGVKTNELVTKYGFPNRRELYYTVYYLRKTGVLPKRKNKLKNSNTVKASNIKQDAKTVNEFRTVYFQDFSVQIHKNNKSRVVVDANNNLHILNS